MVTEFGKYFITRPGITTPTYFRPKAYTGPFKTPSGRLIYISPAWGVASYVGISTAASSYNDAGVAAWTSEYTDGQYSSSDFIKCTYVQLVGDKRLQFSLTNSGAEVLNIKSITFAVYTDYSTTRGGSMASGTERVIVWYQNVNINVDPGATLVFNINADPQEDE